MIAGKITDLVLWFERAVGVQMKLEEAAAVVAKVLQDGKIELELLDEAQHYTMSAVKSALLLEGLELLGLY